MNIKDIALAGIRSRLRFLEAHVDTLIIDADTHATDCAHLEQGLRERFDRSPDYYHGRPIDADDILRQMRLSGVDMALVWQNPAATPYTGDKQVNFDRLRAANQYIFDVSMAYPEKFIPAGWTDPKNLGADGAASLIETCVLEFGFPIIKLNPAQNAFPIDSPVVVEMVRKIVELGAVPAFHYGADTPYTPPEGLEAIARRFPQTTVIGIHMGGGGAGYLDAEQSYQKTREIGLRNPNLHFIMSAKRDTHIETDLIVFQAAGEPYSRNLSCGSDAPYGRMTWNFGGFGAMFRSFQDTANHTDPRIRDKSVVFTSSDIHRYLGGNMARLAIEAYRNLLATHGTTP